MRNLSVRRCFICYIDILGYRSLIKKYGDNEFLKIINNTMVTIIDQVNGQSSEFFTADLCSSINCRKSAIARYHIFSDNIVIFVPMSSSREANFHILRGLVNMAAMLQRNLMGQYGILLRGGITYGPLYCNNDYVYGSGLISAYDIENKLAKHPRILIDKKCMRYIRFAERNISVDEVFEIWLNFMNKKLDIDRDGLMFINYLFYDNQLDDVIGLGYIKLHKELILRTVATIEDPNILAKYIWCREYHNRKCLEYGLGEF